MIALFKVEYDFFRKSEHGISPSVEDVNTLELMMYTYVDPKFFKQILNHLYLTQPANISLFMNQFFTKEERIDNVLMLLRKDIRSIYVDELVVFANEKNLLPDQAVVDSY